MADKFTIEQLDQRQFIKDNPSTKEITNPSMFNATNGPTSDGLLSNEIFGITKDERSGIYGFINLHGNFINPYYYKIWCKIDKNIKACVYETDTFSIDKDGFLVQDDQGSTGLNFLYKNIDKIKFKNTKKDTFLAALNKAKNDGSLFTDTIIVTPPFYRDIDNSDSGRVGVGEINKLYIQLLNAIRSISESSDYGLDMGGGARGRVQDTILEIYNWFTLGESIIGGEHTGSGIFKKFGAMRRTVMGKTTDYAVRLVISASNIEVDSVDDLMVDLDHSAIPLSSCLIIAYPFVIHELRNFFQNEFGGKTTYSYIDKSGNLQEVTLDNPQVAFSDDTFDREINEFVHGYSNRLKPIYVPNKEGKKITLRLKGYSVTAEEYANGKRDGTLIDRDLTWMDLFFIASSKATKDKEAIIVRYPIDSYMNQLYTGIRVASTIKTKPMVINDELYQWYPDISQSDIGSNTSNLFIDTLQMSNLYCGGMGAKQNWQVI